MTPVLPHLFKADAKIRHVYLVAICGTAMASLAGMLKELGYAVRGSDLNVYPPMSVQLQKMGISLVQGYKAENISGPIDLAIIGNAVSRNNEEAQEIVRKCISYISFAQALFEFFLKSKTPAVVAGTHGKTTTTSLLAWILESAGRDPGYFAGGIPTNFSQSFKLGSGPVFVVEGDEYDSAYFEKFPKFLHYHPTHAIITSIEFDHSDIYDSLSTIIGEFKKLVRLIPESGHLVACTNYQTVREVISEASCRVHTYGFHKKADYSAKNIRYKGEWMEFDLLCQKKPVERLATTLVGEHNILNILAAAITARNIGLSWAEIKEGVKTFRGVKRRLEVIGVIGDIVVIDDFAHHPTAIEQTVLACKKRYKDRRLWLIFEPRTNTTRRNIFQKELIEAMSLGDIAIMAEVFKLDAIAEKERLSVDAVIAGIIENNREAHYIPNIDEIVSFVKKESRAGDVILIMSNGGFGGIYQKLLDALKERWG
jgi:UDP-N-acetylmuramate: L-alanyl-gamma-D-glutamyl-meso-diaminopimelate ligase